MSHQPLICETKCNSKMTAHDPRLIVITGGPGAGKTAVLDMAKKILCKHVAILPEAASVVYGGGFWRLPSESSRIAAQKAIFHVQREMENLVLWERQWATGLCDRGTLDGIAYWPRSDDEFWRMTESTLEREYVRYTAVIHLHSPPEDLGYNHSNPLRIESASDAQKIDAAIVRVWRGHPHYHSVESSVSFVSKAERALELIAKFLPNCCQESLKKVPA